MFRVLTQRESIKDKNVDCHATNICYTIFIYTHIHITRVIYTCCSESHKIVVNELRYKMFLHKIIWEYVREMTKRKFFITSPL